MAKKQFIEVKAATQQKTVTVEDDGSIHSFYRCRYLYELMGSEEFDPLSPFCMKDVSPPKQNQ